MRTWIAALIVSVLVVSTGALTLGTSLSGAQGDAGDDVRAKFFKGTLCPGNDDTDIM